MHPLEEETLDFRILVNGKAADDHEFLKKVYRVSKRLNIPDSVMKDAFNASSPDKFSIRKAIYEGLPNARKEADIAVIDGPTPLFIDRKDLTRRVRLLLLFL